MASQKVSPPVLQRFFRNLTYYMYACAPEKPPGLVGRNFLLSHPMTLCESINHLMKKRFYKFLLFVAVASLGGAFIGYLGQCVGST